LCWALEKLQLGGGHEQLIAFIKWGYNKETTFEIMLHLVPTSLVLVLTFEHISLIILVLSKYFLEFFIQSTWSNGLSQIYEDQMMKQHDQILVFHNFAKIKMI
jgi:hypothetical protein